MNTGVNTGKYTVKIQNTNIGKIKYKNTKYSVGGINMNAGVNTVKDAETIVLKLFTFWSFSVDFFLDNRIGVLLGILLLVAIIVKVTTNILKKKMMRMAEQTLGMMMTVILLLDRGKKGG